MKYKINWSRFKGTTKLPAQKVIKESDPYEFSIKKAKESKIRSVFGSDPTKQPTITLGIEEARKVARGIEARSHKGLTQKVETAFKSTISKPAKANQFNKLIKQKQRALTKAFKLSLKRGAKAGERKTEKLGFPKTMFYSGAKDRPASMFKKKSFISAEQSRKLGFPQSEMSLSAKYDLDIGPKTTGISELKKSRGTLSKVYKMPKTPLRAKLKSVYRAQSKANLKLAKMERNIDEYSTVEFKKQFQKKYKPIRKYSVKSNK